MASNQGGSKQPYRGYHDIGGDEGTTINRHEHDYVFWEKRVDALMVLLSDPDRKLLRVDELRRAIESFSPEDYDELTYYQRWIKAITQVMLEKGVVGQRELENQIESLKERGIGK